VSRKQTVRKHKAHPPMMVMRFLHDKKMETQELAAVRAFQWGAATQYHYELLQDMTNMLYLAGCSDDSRTYAKERAEQVYIPAMQNMQRRYEQTGKLGVSASDLKAMLDMVQFSKAFWDRQPIELYHVAGKELKAFYREAKEKRRADNVHHTENAAGTSSHPGSAQSL
jgi:hypothetical protein